VSQFPPTNPGGYPLKAHRGTVVLVLGILSLVIGCFGWILGIIAWTMGNNDLRQMDAGVMDDSGRGLTQAGKICGMVATFLHLIFMVLWFIWLIVFFGIFAAGAASGHR
jgi:hypothetical protein